MWHEAPKIMHLLHLTPLPFWTPPSLISPKEKDRIIKYGNVTAKNSEEDGKSNYQFMDRNGDIERNQNIPNGPNHVNGHYR